MNLVRAAMGLKIRRVEASMDREVDPQAKLWEKRARDGTTEPNDCAPTPECRSSNGSAVPPLDDRRAGRAGGHHKSRGLKLRHARPGEIEILLLESGVRGCAGPESGPVLIRIAAMVEVNLRCARRGVRSDDGAGSN